LTDFREISNLPNSKFSDKIFYKRNPTIDQVVGKRLLNGLEYCVTWSGVKNAAGYYVNTYYAWEVPAKVPQALIEAYEALGPAVTYETVIPPPRPYQHANQQPIQPHEIKDLSGVERIELLANGVSKYEFYKIPTNLKYRAVTRTLRFPYFISRTGLIWNNATITANSKKLGGYANLSIK
jgi:hypothetical protein